MIQQRIQVSFPSGYWRKFYKRSPVYQPKSGEYLLNHNRSGLLVALKALQLPEGSCVGVMAYNCHTVMNAVEEAGCKVVFIDVTLDLTLDLNDLRKKCKVLSALIVSHLFGIANDVDAIRTVSSGIPIIEDCAHAYGMISCGAKGEFASYSIGVGKFPSIGDGGILKVNDLKYLEAVERQISVIPNYNKRQEFRLLTKLFAMRLLYMPVIYSFITLPLLKRGRNKVAKAKEQIVLSRMSTWMSSVYEMELPLMIEQMQRQQSVAESMAVYFSKRTDCRVINANLKNSICFMFPVYCESPEQLKQEFRHKAIETETHFRHCIIWCKAYGYQEGDCPNAELLVNHLLMIPTYKEVKL